MMRRHRWAAGLLATTLALGLAACGGGGDAGGVASLGDGAAAAADDDGGGRDQRDRDQALLDYARCMREQGVDMPDPEFDDDGRARLQVIGPGGDREAFEAAEEECQEHLDGAIDGGPGIEPDPEFQDRLIRFARCMREHGVDMPDPQFGEGGMVRMRPGDAAPFDPGDPAFEAAQKACEQFMPEAPGRAGDDR